MDTATPLASGAPVVVTGGASGLGRAVATRLDGLGGTVTVLDRRPSPDGLATEIVDLAEGRAAEDALARAAKNAGGLWAVVTCAGVDVPGRLDEVAAEDWERVIAVNLVGTAAVVRAALPYLVPARGRIVTVASTLGHRAVSDATAYCASKFGVVGFSRALTAELRDQVGVTMLTPGGMHTAFFDEREERYKPPADLRLADPGDVAEAVAFALTRPPGCEVRELVVTPPTESSWP
ncbi:MAG TPA: SDR family oxidoreductase [Acidimicrobiales bacterium]|jgi:NAD(P)-dependent dehydrogenase (short-subunit alcohol dehydrogenase family)|nr:SDR family oxidoreductase [Acidimicrobiales bacterium]